MKSKLFTAAAVVTIAVPATTMAVADDAPTSEFTPETAIATLTPAPKARSAAWTHDHNRLLGRHVRLTRGVSGDKAAHHVLHEHADWSNGHLSTANQRLRKQLKAHRARARARAAAAAAQAAQTVAVPAIMQRIAQCESGGNPRAIGGGGAYRGKYQFDYQTWQANGGSGDPAAASEAEQDRVAMRLYQARGTSPWPVCGG
jgi:transglycosylase-like protein